MPAPKRLTPEMVGEKRRRTLPPVPDEPLKVDFDHIPMRQVIRIERLAGVRLTEWGGGESDGQKLAALVSVMYDVDYEVVIDETAETLAKYAEVVLPATDDDDAGEDDDQGNA